MANPCQPGIEGLSPEARLHIDNMRKMVNKWMNPNGEYKNIAKRYEDNWDGAERGLRDLFESHMNIPFSENFHLNEMQWKHVKKLSHKYNKKIGGKWSNFWSGVVPEYVTFQDPTAVKYEQSLNNISQFEKHNIAANAHASAEISNFLKEAYISEGHKKGIIGTPVINKIRKIQKKIIKSKKESDKISYMEELSGIVNSDKGKIIKDFINLSEMNNADFQKVSRMKNYTVFSKDGSPSIVNVDANTINSVKASRKNFDRLGDISIHTINKIKRLVDLKFDAMLGDRTSPQYKNFKESLDEAVGRIKQNQENGGYLPRYLMESIIDIKVNMDNVYAAKSTEKMQSKLDVLSGVLNSINTGRMADRFKARNEMLDNIYNTDPLYMVTQYGKEVSSLNKLASFQEVYLKAMRDIPKTDLRFVDGLKKFINEQYIVSSEGLSGRPDWVNNMTRAIAGYQIARTMGFNLTGAAKNTSSMLYYMHELGKRNYFKAKRLIKHDIKIQQAMADIKSEQGFLFPDISREIVTHGLLPAEGIHKSDIQVDPFSGAITVDGKDLTRTAEWANMGIDGLLFFHKVSENYVRNNIFETAFAHKYKELIDTPEFVTHKEGKFSELAAKRFSKNFALNMVNQYAYEYSIHAKSRYIRGQEFYVDSKGDKQIVGNSKFLGNLKGATQQLSFQLMHYPMSLAGTHQHKFKGAFRELQVGDYAGQNMQFWGRYASVAAMLGLGSIAMGFNAFNIVDHDLFNRIKQFHDILIDNEDVSSDKDHFGLLSLFSGPTVSHINFLSNWSGLLNVDDNEWQEMVFGSIDYRDPDNKSYLWYQLGTAPGMIMNKLYPTTVKGRGYDNIRHILKLYPSGWTKEYNKKLYGRQDKVRVGSGADVQLRLRALQVLKGM